MIQSFLFVCLASMLSLDVLSCANDDNPTPPPPLSAPFNLTQQVFHHQTPVWHSDVKKRMAEKERERKKKTHKAVGGGRPSAPM